MGKLLPFILFLSVVFNPAPKSMESHPAGHEIAWSPPIAYEELADHAGEVISYLGVYVVEVSWMDRCVEQYDEDGNFTGWKCLPSDAPTEYRMLLATYTEDSWGTYRDLVLVKSHILPTAAMPGNLLAVSARVLGPYCPAGVFDCENGSIPALELVQ